MKFRLSLDEIEQFRQEAIEAYQNAASAIPFLARSSEVDRYNCAFAICERLERIATVQEYQLEVLKRLLERKS